MSQDNHLIAMTTGLEVNDRFGVNRALDACLGNVGQVAKGCIKRHFTPFWQVYSCTAGYALLTGRYAETELHSHEAMQASMVWGFQGK